MGMWDDLGKKGRLPQNNQGTIEKTSEKKALEEEQKKRKTYLKYNRAKHGVFGDKSQPDLIEKEL